MEGHAWCVAVSKIKPALYNPRKDLQLGEPQYEKIKRSMERFGYVDSIVWNKRSGNLVGGHQRFKILAAEGATAIDVSVADLSAGEEKALNVALNKTSGKWDDLKLAELFTDLRRDSAIDETVTGFDIEEIDLQPAEALNEVDGAAESVSATEAHQSYRVVANSVDEKQQKKVVTLLEKQGVACHTLTRE